MKTVTGRDLIRAAIAEARGEPAADRAELLLLLGRSENDFVALVDSAGRELYRAAVVNHLTAIRKLLETIVQNTIKTEN